MIKKTTIKRQKASFSASNAPLFKDVTPCLPYINRIHKDNVLHSNPASIQLSTLCKYWVVFIQSWIAKLIPCVCILKDCLSCPTLCNPTDCSPPGSSVYGIFQARILEWVAISSSPGDLPTQRWNLSLQCLLHWQVGSLLQISCEDLSAMHMGCFRKLDEVPPDQNLSFGNFYFN